MTQVLVDGLCFGEGPRWRDGKLWFSDMHANTVYTVDPKGNLETIVTLDDDQPSGLGWLPDGRLLVVSMLDRRLLPGETEESVRSEIESSLLRHGIENVSVDWCKLEKGPLATPHDHVCVRRCQEALAQAKLPTAPDIASFGTDAGVFLEYGVPGVVLGPGSIQQAHSACEWVEARQVEQMTELLVRLLEGGD